LATIASPEMGEEHFYTPGLPGRRYLSDHYGIWGWITSLRLELSGVGKNNDETTPLGLDSAEGVE